MKKKLLLTAGAVVALAFLFGIPAVLVRVSMDDVPDRSKTKVVAVYEEAINIVQRTYAMHRRDDNPGRLRELPADSHGWIEVINPLGRKAPGGGFAILPEANRETGAIGLRGNQASVTITMPAYRDMQSHQTVITAQSGVEEGR